MGNNKDIRIVLSKLRYKSSPELSYGVNIPFVQTTNEIIEYDRTSNISLAQVFDDERQKSTIFRPVCKFSILFKNSYVGNTNYPPFENNLVYINAAQAAKDQCLSGANSVKWSGYPQYNEFDFIRNDNNVVGYTIPPDNHLTFVNKSASTYNWNFFLSYPYKNLTTKVMSFYDEVSQNDVSWVCGDGLPFVIQNVIEGGDSVVRFKCPVKHGLSVGEYVELSFNYNSDKYFEVYSLGDGTVDSDGYTFNIYNYGFTGNIFNDGKTGTFKRVLDIDNPSDTTSTYYVRQLKLLSNVDDYNLVKAGFEQSLFGKTKKYESEAFTPNKTARVSLKEGSQSYLLSFNTDFDLKPLRDNQKRPISELFFNVIWKGYFGWTMGAGFELKEGFNFNLPMINGKPSTWWAKSNPNSSTGFKNGSYNKPGYNFTYVKSLTKGDVIDGDYCEWNDYEQMERVISNVYHKFTFNYRVFDPRVKTTIPIDNMEGYYYQPNFSMPIRVYSDYIEDAELNPNYALNIPDYSYFSTRENKFIWRDIYTYGFIDPNGRGVNYPFTNGKHYPTTNVTFRLIPEGTNYFDDTTINIPKSDNCE
jgi:hypothetical protein